MPGLRSAMTVGVLPTFLPSTMIIAFAGSLFILTEPTNCISTAVMWFSIAELTSTVSLQISYPSILTSIRCLPGVRSFTSAGVLPTSLPSITIVAFAG